MAVILLTRAVITGTPMPTPGISQLWWLPGSAGGSTADATDCLARFHDVWDTFKTSISSALTFNFDPTVIAVEATTGVLSGAFTGTEPADVVGTGSGDILPLQTQGLLRLGTSTIINGRRVRGRLFVPGPIESVNAAGGVPSGSYVTDVTAGGATLFDAGATSSEPVVWHRPVNGAGGSHALVTSVACAPTWSVLRSRRS